MIHPEEKRLVVQKCATSFNSFFLFLFTQNSAQIWTAQVRGLVLARLKIWIPAHVACSIRSLSSTFFFFFFYIVPALKSGWIRRGVGGVEREVELSWTVCSYSLRAKNLRISRPTTYQRTNKNSQNCMRSQKEFLSPQQKCQNWHLKVGILWDESFSRLECDHLLFFPFPFSHRYSGSVHRRRH